MRLVRNKDYAMRYAWDAWQVCVGVMGYGMVFVASDSQEAWQGMRLLHSSIWQSHASNALELWLN